MLKINCLLANSPLVGNLQTYMRLIAADLMAYGTKPSFINVYNGMREQGVELDLQTADHLYSNAFNLNDPDYSSRAEIDKHSGRTLNKLLTRTLTAIQTKEIKGDSPVVVALSSVLDRILPRVGSNPTLQKQMEQKLTKWATNRILAAGQTVPAKPYQQLVAEAMALTIRNPYQAPAGSGIIGTLDDSYALQEEFKQLFQDFINGVPATSPYNKALMQLNLNMLASVPYQLMLSNNEVKRVISGTLIDAGYGRVVNSKAGPKPVVDWGAIFRDSPDIYDLVNKVFSATGLYTPSQIGHIYDSISQDYNNAVTTRKINLLEQRNKAAVKISDRTRRSELERLFELYDLGIFQAATQDALFRVLGVDSIDASMAAEIRDILRIAKTGYHAPGSEFSPTFHKLIKRAIDRRVNKMEERGNFGLQLVRTLAYNNQLMSGFIIANLQNSLFQNTLSGLVEVFSTMIQNPRIIPRVVKEITNAWLDITLGGARVGTEIGNMYDIQGGSYSENFNLGNARTLKERTAAYFYQIVRMTLDAVDGGFKQGLIHMHTTNVAARLLLKYNKANGTRMTRDEANLIVNEMWYRNLPEIEQQAELLTRISLQIGEINRSMLSTTKRRIMGELARASLTSQGNGFNIIIQQLASEGKISGANFQAIPEPALRGAVSAANSVAGRGLGHESEFSVFRGSIDKMLSDPAEHVKRARASKYRTGRQRRADLTQAEWYRLALSSGLRFFGGSLRWLILGALRMNYIPLGVEVVLRAGKDASFMLRPTIPGQRAAEGGLKELLSLDNINIDYGNERLAEEAITRWQATRQRLVREFVGSTMSYIIGYQLLLPALLGWWKGLGGGDEEKRKKALTEEQAWAEFSEWVMADKGRKRWLQMIAPLSTYTYVRGNTSGKYDRVARDAEDIVLPSFKQLHTVFNGDTPNKSMLLRGFEEQYNTNAMITGVQRIQEEFNKKDPDAGFVMKQILMGLWNPLGILTFWELNRRAVVSAQALLSDNPNKSSTLSDYQLQSIKPETPAEEWIYSMMNKEQFAYLYQKDVSRFAPVSDKVLNDYENTLDKDLLPPLPTARLEDEGYQFKFTKQDEVEWIKGLQDGYLTVTNQRVEPDPSWESLSTEWKKERLKDYYDEIRDRQKASWVSKIPKTDPRWRKKKTEEE